jgi:hypothetical protein
VAPGASLRALFALPADDDRGVVDMKLSRKRLPVDDPFYAFGFVTIRALQA